MRYLGLDLGTKTLGLSVSDKTNTFALPLTTLEFPKEDYPSILPDLQAIVKEKEISTFVLGFPKKLNNTYGKAAERSLYFKELLENYFHLPVYLMDERLTTVEAENILKESNKKRKKRKEVVDNVASSLILETFLKKINNYDIID